MVITNRTQRPSIHPTSLHFTGAYSSQMSLLRHVHTRLIHEITLSQHNPMLCAFIHPIFSFPFTQLHTHTRTRIHAQFSTKLDKATTWVASTFEPVFVALLLTQNLSLQSPDFDYSVPEEPPKAAMLILFPPFCLAFLLVFSRTWTWTWTWTGTRGSESENIESYYQ